MAINEPSELPQLLRRASLPFISRIKFYREAATVDSVNSVRRGLHHVILERIFTACLSGLH